MMGPWPQCYIPSHNIIGPLVLEKKIFERILPNMGVVAILVMWPRRREQTFVPPSHWEATWNLALIGPMVLEKKIFENGGRTTDVDRPWLYYKLTNEPKGSDELKKKKKKKTVYKHTHIFMEMSPERTARLNCTFPFWSIFKSKTFT